VRPGFVVASILARSGCARVLAGIARQMRNDPGALPAGTRAHPRIFEGRQMRCNINPLSMTWR
jgi:hypothetical protein